MEQIVSVEDFEAKVLKSELPVMVDCTAEWCGPCQFYAPVIHDLAEELQGRANVYKIDCDESPELVQACRIASIPTVMFFEGGQVKDFAVGIQPKEYLLEQLFKPLEQSE